jgi:CheY-like chemotaxis protein
VAGVQAAVSPPEVREVQGGTELILLVEDDPSVRRSTTRVLERFGYAVVSAPDGKEAFTYLTSDHGKPALVISDVVMPRLSGPQLLGKIREAGLSIRVLFTSGYTQRDMKERTMLDPALPFLAKPWTVPDLLSKVRDVLDAPSVT